MDGNPHPSPSLKVAESSAEWIPKHVDVVASFFVATLLISNIAAQKLFQLGPAVFTAGILVFPISYIFGDVLTEVYGFNRSRKIIYCGLLANVFMVLVLSVAISLPPAPGWTLQNEFEAIHRPAARIVFASMLAYVAGELVNSLVMSRLKVRTQARALWFRAIASTMAGQFVDTSIFVLAGFAGSLPNDLLFPAIVSGWLFKVVYEAAAVPLTYMVSGYLKRLEGVEHFDSKEHRTLV